MTPSTAKDAYVVDDIGLPFDNPWRRNVRLCDIAFFKDGTAAAHVGPAVAVLGVDDVTSVECCRGRR